MTNEELVVKLIAEKKQLAILRDELRNLQEIVEHQLDAVDRGYEALEECVDCLSELV